MASALKMLTHPDGKTCMFSDSPCNLSSATGEGLIFVEKLSGTIQDIDSLNTAGYYKLKNNDFYVVADFGDLGPDEQMGHSHSDMLHFELSYRGTRILVEGGTSSYYDPVRREYERSTSAHNTITINDYSQSTNWGNFRVAERGHCKLISASLGNPSEKKLIAAHDGYKKKLGVVHKREIKCHDNEIIVTDTLLKDTKTNLQISSFLHFSKFCKIEATSDTSAIIKLYNEQELFFYGNNLIFTLDEMQYAQNYNELQTGTLLKMEPVINNEDIVFYISNKMRN